MTKGGSSVISLESTIPYACTENVSTSSINSVFQVQRCRLSVALENTNDQINICNSCTSFEGFDSINSYNQNTSSWKKVHEIQICHQDDGRTDGQTEEFTLNFALSGIFLFKTSLWSNIHIPNVKVCSITTIALFSAVCIVREFILFFCCIRKLL